MALKNNDLVRCFVDENGRYTRDMGYELEGKYVLDEGTDAALQLLRKNIVHSHKYHHQYPYDWRTKQPVMIRSSAQWFIDVSKVGMEAAELVRNKDIPVGSTNSDKSAVLCTELQNRLAWCISRQRCWGVPIPAFFKQDESTVLDKEIIGVIADRVARDGPDVWWQCDASDLFPFELRKKHGIADFEQLTKSNDVMDVWMDSGMVWTCTRDTTNAADLVIEGIDQFRGWFQSLLLTSFALKKKAPYKRVLVHAFAVDENEQKMSKSSGNVVDPELSYRVVKQITDGSLKTEPLGVDCLRFWVAQYGCEGDKARIGDSVLENVKQSVHQIRKTFSYLLGTLDGYQEQLIENRSQFLLDKYMLREMTKFSRRCVKNFEEYRFGTMISEYLQFIQRPLSSLYLRAIKDRLYCGTIEERNAVQDTLMRVSLNLTALIAPILPHLATEVFMHHPCVNDVIEAMRNVEKFYCDYEVIDDEMNNAINAGLDAMHIVMEQFGQKNMQQVAIKIRGDVQALRTLQSTERSYNSQLVEVLGVSMVELKSDPSITGLAVCEIECDREFCKRCRRNRRCASETYCDRCTESLAQCAHFAQSTYGSI